MAAEKRKVEVAWICNGKNRDCKKYGCFYKPPHNGIRGSCMHTTNPKYAKNRPRDPKRYPEYFDKFKYENNVRYYEREEPKE